MTFFETIASRDFVGTSILVVDEEKIYLEINERKLPESGYGFLRDGRYVYCVNWRDKRYCSDNTTRIPILYFYEASEYDISLSSCLRIEYTSAALRRLMCTYRDNDNNEEKYIDDKFEVGNITIKFSGNRIYSEPRFIDYNMLDPAVVIEAETPLKPNQVLKYVQAIDDFLRLVFFEKSTALPNIRLVGEDDRYLSFQVVSRDVYQKYYLSFYENIYDEIKDSIPAIFNYVLNQPLDSSFFIPYTMCENMQSLFINTYAAFDKLSDKAGYNLAANNTDFDDFKEKIWEIIENDEDFEKVKDQIGNLKEKIMSHGNTVGHKEKLKRAFRDVLQIIPVRARCYHLYDEEIINRIYKLRTEIIHKGKIIEFSGEDIFCLEKLQWITYVILLRLIKIDDGVIENWMDRVMGVG